MSNEEEIQEAVLAALDAALVQPIYEVAIPDSKTVVRDSAGKIAPYIAIQFGDLTTGTTTSFAGPRGDDYVLPIYTQAVGPTAKIARQIGNRVRDAMLGLDFPWTGDINKRAGGGAFVVNASNGATEAYVSAASFGLPIQYE